MPDGDVALALRLARYCARNPVALERLEYDGSARQVRYRSDTAAGPTAGTEIVDPLEFLARVTAHIPNNHQVLTRDYEPCDSISFYGAGCQHARPLHADGVWYCSQRPPCHCARSRGAGVVLSA